MRMKLRPISAIILSALLAAGGVVRAQQEETESLTPDERREAGEFLLRLDRSWHTSSNPDALVDQMFVGDFVSLSRSNPLALRYLPGSKELFTGLSDAQLKRVAVANLDMVYLAGRIYLTFGQWKKNREGANAAATRCGERNVEGCTPPGEGDADEPPIEEVFGPAVLEVFKGNPQFAAALAEEQEGEDGAGKGKEPEITTPEQLFDWVEMMEHAAVKMRVRLKELEGGSPGPPPSAVPREDEDEGELPDLRLRTLEEVWMNRPVGTRVVCGYLSSLHVDLVWEGGQYRVLAAYLED
jgi:hypothetical protein